MSHDRWSKKKLLLPINLHFFDAGEKTEQPTSKKRNSARNKGNVALSKEVGTAFLFLSVFYALKTYAPGMVDKSKRLMEYNFVLIADLNDLYSNTFITKYVYYNFMQVLLIVMPIFIISMGVGVITSLAQVGWHPTTVPLMPKLTRFNPVSGFKKLFSFKSVINLLKSMVIFCVIAMQLYSILSKEVSTIMSLIDMELVAALVYLGNLAVDLGISVGTIYLVIAALDLFYTRYSHNKSLKMSKHEVKEEHKQAEGNPQVKSKIRQKMREVSMRRMMQNVPTADVIITNPTHYAVAIRYDRMAAEAPVVVAKGVDFLAKRIKDAAAEHDVYVIENRPLARTLYATVDVGSEVPPDLYEAVAEILAFVYRLKNVI